MQFEKFNKGHDGLFRRTRCDIIAINTTKQLQLRVGSVVWCVLVYTGVYWCVVTGVVYSGKFLIVSGTLATLQINLSGKNVTIFCCYMTRRLSLS